MGDTTLTPEQYRLVCRSLRTWLDLKLTHERGGRFQTILESGDAQRIAQAITIDAEHSALLPRLLIEGKDPLSDPPPLNMFSRPDYTVDEATRDG